MLNTKFNFKLIQNNDFDQSAYKYWLLPNKMGMVKTVWTGKKGRFL